MSYPIRARRYGWISGLTGAPGTPAAPTVTQTATGMVLDWVSNTEADVLHYIITRRLTGVGPYVEKATRIGSRYADNAVVEGQGYDYQIKAVDAQGLLSAARTVTNQVWVWAPAVPTGLAVVDDPGVGVDLTWDANTETDIAGYIVKRSATLGGVYATVSDPVPLDALLMSDALLEADEGEDFFYKIQAQDDAGNLSALSAAVSVTHAAAP